ncbi:hypothetical protein ABNX05_11515 [Lysinibacillus sp. M3]|uniref:Uncharacterized protein n=1 Tax=Lysinibacillus zambalensis TaxID=3160866 RepID=A0ABV1MRV7_9BACI
MAGFVALGNDLYIGTYKSAVKNGVENGQWVVLDHKVKTGTLADATTGDKEVYFVVNEVDTVDEQSIDTVDYKVKEGEYLRLKKPQVGEILVATKFNGTLAEGDEVAVGAGGNVEAIGSRTPITKLVVKEKTNEYGEETLRLLVL